MDVVGVTQLRICTPDRAASSSAPSFPLVIVRHVVMVLLSLRFVLLLME
jgi:hypothetical protein